MSESSLLSRFIGDLKTSWPKTALLAALFCVGLYFWVPPLYRAIAGATSRPVPPATPVTPATAATTSSPKATVPPPTGTPVGNAEQERPQYAWQNVDELLQRDPLAHSAEAATISADALEIDYDQFPPPLLFAEESEEDNPRAPEPNPAPEESTNDLDQLVLGSTIVGANRRAALINRKLYREGSDIPVGGRVYRLESVQARKVVLRRGEEQFELTIAEGNRTGGVGAPTAGRSEGK